MNQFSKTRTTTPRFDDLRVLYGPPSDEPGPRGDADRLRARVEAIEANVARHESEIAALKLALFDLQATVDRLWRAVYR